jgi:hypothetical protein
MIDRLTFYANGISAPRRQRREPRAPRAREKKHVDPLPTNGMGFAFADVPIILLRVARRRLSAFVAKMRQILH